MSQPMLEGEREMQNEDSAKGKSAQTFMERMSTLTDVFIGRAGLTELPPFTEYLSMPEGYKAPGGASQDRKSTRLNSSHSQISYAVFCLKKKKKKNKKTQSKDDG